MLAYYKRMNGNIRVFFHSAICAPSSTWSNAHPVVKTRRHERISIPVPVLFLHNPISMFTSMVVSVSAQYFECSRTMQLEQQIDSKINIRDILSSELYSLWSMLISRARRMSFQPYHRIFKTFLIAFLARSCPTLAPERDGVGQQFEQKP